LFRMHSSLTETSAATDLVYSVIINWFMLAASPGHVVFTMHFQELMQAAVTGRRNRFCAVAL
jgi:hypothetical protein